MDSLTHLQTATLIVAAALAMLTNFIHFLINAFLIPTYYRRIREARHPSNRDPGLSSTKPLCERYRRVFLTMIIVEPIIITATQATFCALSWNRGRDWPLYLTSSIIISSMIREVSSPGFIVDEADNS